MTEGGSTTTSVFDEPFGGVMGDAELEYRFLRTLLADEPEWQDELWSSPGKTNSIWGTPAAAAAAAEPEQSVASAAPYVLGTASNSIWNDSFVRAGSSKGSSTFSAPRRLEVGIHRRPATRAPLPLTQSNLERLTLAQDDHTQLRHVQEPTTPKASRKSKPKKTKSSTAPQGPESNVLYKTELCEAYTTKGKCRFGKNCKFAHGLDELQVKATVNNFRTKPCNNWDKLGYCPYGKRCCFKHGDDYDIKIYLAAGKYVGNNDSRQQKHQNENKQTQKNLNVKVKALQNMKW